MPTVPCFHCGEPIADATPLVARIGGAPRPVCCVGCRAAAEWIATLGLQDYYRLREASPPRAAATTDHSVWDRAELQKLYVHRRPDGSAEVTLLVEGLRCAACSWLIERALAQVAGVVRCAVNVAARRVTIGWRPEAVPLSAVLESIGQLGYAVHPLDRGHLDDVATREQRSALKRLIVAGLGMMQASMFAIVLYAGGIDGIDPATRDFFRWIGLLVTVPVVFYSGRPFFAGALRELRARHPGMDTPIALAVASVFAASVFETLTGGAAVYFDSASMFVFLLLGGRYLEMRTRHRAAEVVDALARLQPPVARRVTASGAIEDVGVQELVAGDRVVVADGVAVPADGVLLSEACRVDESLLSGEARPLHRSSGETLVAGSVIVEGPAEIRVERLGADTTLAAIVRLAGDAQNQRPRWVRRADRYAAWFVHGLLLATFATAAAWLLIDPSRAFSSALAVLVVACPCAFALAVPAALARALAVLARRGALVVSSDAVEALQRVDCVVFDKTGTLTDRAKETVDVSATASTPVERCRAIAAGLEAASMHPLAAAVRRAADGLPVAHAANLRSIPGAGVEGDVDGHRCRLGHAAFALDRDLQDRDEDLLLTCDGFEIARLSPRETLRPEAAATVAALTAAGIAVELLSGDSAARVAGVATRLGIADWRARRSPADKLARLAELQQSGRTVAVVGDGVNDAPALAGADLAVAVGGGADLAHSNADIVLASDRLDTLVEARRVAGATARIMHQNMLWAVAYNLVAVPLAALGFVPPWLAVLGMSASSLGVIANSLRLRANPAPAERSDRQADRERLSGVLPA